MKILRLLLVTLPFVAADASAQRTMPQVYPRIAGYAGLLHAITTFSSAGTETNFSHYYAIGVPVGINIWKSPIIGFSAEFVPMVRMENGSSKVANFTFHPGVLVALGKGFTFVARAAFETSGRYGITPVFNKTVIKRENSSYFVAVPLPLRFGNDKPAAFTAGLQFGIAF